MIGYQNPTSTSMITATHIIWPFFAQKNQEKLDLFQTNAYVKSSLLKMWILYITWVASIGRSLHSFMYKLRSFLYWYEKKYA